MKKGYCFVFHVTVTRWEFLAYLEEIGVYNHADIKQRRQAIDRTKDVTKLPRNIQDQYRKALKDLVVEDYIHLGYEIELTESQYEFSFPSANTIRDFTVIIRFKNKEEVNKMKLKHPRIYEELKNA